MTPGRTGKSPPDDIKIIAQFLADGAADPSGWRRYVQEAARLRRQLKQRGGYRIARLAGSGAPSD